MQKEIVIRAKQNSLNLGFKELWNYRELLLILTWRDIKVRYKETLLGIGWVLFQPIVTTLIFSIFFGRLAKIPSGNLPYPIFVYTGLVIWTFFANALTSSSNSLFSNESIITKVYFPRLIIPLSAILTSSVDFLITIIFGLLLIFYFRLSPSPLILVLFPILVLILFIIISGLGLFFAVLKARYRDVRYIFPFFLQLGIFVSPVIYPLDVIHGYKYWFLALNPLSGIIEALRVVLSGSNDINWWLILLSGGISLVLFGVGLSQFRRSESDLADVI